MTTKKLRVLLIIENCNPEWYSVPLVGYCYYNGISQLVDTTLVTHERNRKAMEKAHPDRDVVYIQESEFIQKYAKYGEKLCKIGDKIIWPLYNSLMYPVYGSFNRKVHEQFKDRILSGEFDIVHALTPMLPRYPVKVVNACDKTPFVLGPVNGGVPFPEGFKSVANQEFAFLNFIRLFGRYLIPGYRETYEKADHILSGSSYTLGMLQDMFKIEDDRIELSYENGIKSTFLEQGKRNLAEKDYSKEQVDLLFVGRLVPYKGGDMLIDALGRMSEEARSKFKLTVVGDGPERPRMEALVKEHKLDEHVTFTGWVSQDDTLNYYKTADIFCFPSVREFGGAVVLEAMANGLPCVVVNNGGIGEYVGDKTGFKVDPISREYVIEESAKHIQTLIEDTTLRRSMAEAAIDYIGQFTWEAKAKDMVEMYSKVIASKQSDR